MKTSLTFDSFFSIHPPSGWMGVRFDSGIYPTGGGAASSSSSEQVHHRHHPPPVRRSQRQRETNTGRTPVNEATRGTLFHDDKSVGICIRNQAALLAIPVVLRCEMLLPDGGSSRFLIAHRCGSVGWNGRVRVVCSNDDVTIREQIGRRRCHRVVFVAAGSEIDVIHRERRVMEVDNIVAILVLDRGC